MFLPSLPAPSPPKIVAGNSWSNSDKIRDLQKSLRDTFDRNRETYQLKSSEVNLYEKILKITCIVYVMFFLGARTRKQKCHFR